MGGPYALASGLLEDGQNHGSIMVENRSKILNAAIKSLRQYI